MTRRGAMVAALLLGAPGVALGQNTLALVIGGEAYDGPPKFEVLFDGHKVGEGTIESAIDTATQGRFAQATVKAPYIERFEFDIPDSVFNAGGVVRVRFLNEAYGGHGSNRDRNLFIATVEINGAEVPALAMTTQSAAGLEPSAILGDFLVIHDGTADGVAGPPDMGWPRAGSRPQTEIEVAAVPDPEPELEVEPEPEVAVAAVEPVPEPDVVVEAEVAAEPEPVVEAAPVEVAEPVPAVVEAAPAETEIAAAPPVAEPIAPVATSEPIETTRLEVAVAPQPAPARVPAAVAAPAAEAVAAVGEPVAADPATAGCALDNLYNVLGFNENSNDLTPRIMGRLDQIIADIGDNTCTLRLTGYSSTQGDFATNALFAVERAQNVLRYLRENGVRYTSAEALGAGETDQFGPAFSDNRRVVITVKP